MTSLIGRRSKLAFAIFLCPAFVFSCTGMVTGIQSGGGGGSGGAASVSGGSGGTPGTGTGTGGSGTPGGGTTGAGTGGSGIPPAGTGGMTVVVGPMVVPVPESAGPLVIRRMTHREFNHTVQDLLGDTTNIADSWAVDDGSTNSGFQAPNSVDKTTLTYMETSVGTVVDSAIAANRIAIPCTNPVAGAAETTCATQFIKAFGRNAYRRPVTTLEAAGLMTVFTTAHTAPVAYDFKTSIAQVVKAMLLSPNFLYHHWEIGSTKLTKVGALVNLTPHQIASRLSYFLWESMPDTVLLDAADAGLLSTPDQVAAQALRMFADKAHATQTTNALFNFHAQWLQYPNLGQVTKDSQRYPIFTQAFNDALQPEVTSFVASVMLSPGDGTLKTLLTAPYAFANATTAPVYGKTVTGTAMQRIDLDPTQRAGILTQSAFLSTSGAPSGSFPIRRGLIVLGQLMCGTILPPPANLVIPDLPAVDGTTIKTTRQATAAHDSMPCAFCHKDFDPLGFGFENYDGIGAYRTMENGQMVDATGSGVTPMAKQAFSFKNGLELINFLANNDEVKSCTARQWFRYLLGRPEVSADEGSIQAAAKQASANAGFSIPDLLVGMAKSMSFRMRSAGVGEPI
jgi:Protein of unknown function (DUF1592)/Protein of unknown function (DUF1588)/Protein of unknown function (DUF1595)/Protein of unknown function (DUF1585)/Protein of unknown function (DUF1587)